MSYSGRNAWDACWELDADERKPVFVGTLIRDTTPYVAIRVGTTGIPAVISPDDAQTLRAHLQAAIDEAEVSQQLAARRDRARRDALQRVRDCSAADDSAGRDAAITAAIDAEATFSDAAEAAGLDSDEVRQIWRTQVDAEQST
ncbi:hypothetical protein [Haloechinothrix salitolerans]|uniref:Uncharacterized protein n=1 Tax=Haloechinothrix salitolerans TaxID=926830 RepID=A0ABW2BUH9_9PSEU